jgi:CheY-like chemotaxis protein
VLVVDDDPGVREVLELSLLTEGYEVQAAANGREALAVLQRWRPDLILLDLMMPVLDGWSFRAEQLARRGLSDIPVIVLSAGAAVRRHAQVLAAADVLEKPFDLDTLLRIVRSVLG